MSNMRAKMEVCGIENRWSAGETKSAEVLTFRAVAKNDGYPADGSDEDNSYAKWTPQADLSITVANPALWGQFKVGQKFYVDFTKAPQ